MNLDERERERDAGISPSLLVLAVSGKNFRIKKWVSLHWEGTIRDVESFHAIV